MNPFRALKKLKYLPATLRARLRVTPPIFVERPPRSRSPQRSHVVLWAGSQLNPIPVFLERIEEHEYRSQ